MTRNNRVIQADSAPSARVFNAALPLGELVEAAGDGEKKLKTFSMVAYNGVPVAQFWSQYPIIIDLKGLDITAKSRPILKAHRRDAIVGHTTSIKKSAGKLLVEGVISGTGGDAQEIIATAANGFPWQASIGAPILEEETIPAGKSVRVNGQTYTGPLIVARKSKLAEISVVALGADDDTVMSVAAQSRRDKEKTVTFEAWAQQNGFDLAEMSEAAITKLRTVYASEQSGDDTGGEGGGGNGDGTPPAQPKKPAKPRGVAADDTGDDEVAAYRTKVADERKRVAAIGKLCKGKHPDIEAKAIEEGWNLDRVELEVERAERPKAPAAHSVDATMNDNVLEAACAISGKLLNVEKAYDEKTLAAADRRFRHGISLKELLVEAALRNGYSGHGFRDIRAILEAAYGRGRDVRAGFSTINISNILSNLANKFLLEGFNFVESTWRRVCSVRSVVDFKEVTSHRLVGIDQYERVAPTGELKHGTLGDETYTNKADTFGIILSIDRRDIVNDDLGAITTAPKKLGAGAGRAINSVFWTEFLDNASFFTTGNGNYDEGADTALGITGLTLAETLFMKLVDRDGNPIGTEPRIVLVPPELKALAESLHNSTEMRDTTASKQFPVNNPHAGKFKPEVSRYLSNAAFAGYSTTAYYLLGDPMGLSAIEVAFLNGREAPIVETADADFDVLGIKMRGYHDFGVRKQEPLAGVKMKGAA